MNALLGKELGEVLLKGTMGLAAAAACNGAATVLAPVAALAVAAPVLAAGASFLVDRTNSMLDEIRKGQADKRDMDFTQSALNHHILLVLLDSQRQGLLAAYNRLKKESDDGTFPVSKDNLGKVEQFVEQLTAALTAIEEDSDFQRELLNELGMTEEQLYEALESDVANNEGNIGQDLSAFSDKFIQSYAKANPQDLSNEVATRFRKHLAESTATIFIEELKSDSKLTNRAFRAYQLFAYRSPAHRHRNQQPARFGPV